MDWARPGWPKAPSKQISKNSRVIGFDFNSGIILEGIVISLVQAVLIARDLSDLLHTARHDPIAGRSRMLQYFQLRQLFGHNGDRLGMGSERPGAP